MKHIFQFIIYLIILTLIKNEKIVEINSNETQVIVLKNKLFYITNNQSDNNIHIIDLSKDEDNDNEKTINISDIKKNKILSTLNEEIFIILGYDHENQGSNLYIRLYNSSSYEIAVKNKIISFPYYSNINIKRVNETVLLFYAVEERNLIIYRLNLESNNSIYSQIQTKQIIQNGNLNTIECDSFDGKKILCVYSIILQGENIKFNYSFFNLDNMDYNHKNEINKNFEDIRAVSINKLYLNDEQKYIMCFIHYVSTSNNYQLYCQTIVETDFSNSPLHIDNIIKIEDALHYGLESRNYIKKIPIKIVLYNYSIYILLELDDRGHDKVILYGCSLDLGLNFELDTGVTFENKFSSVNILINSYYNMIFYEKLREYKTNIYSKDNFLINCSDFEIQFTSKNKNSEIDIKNNFINQAKYSLYKYISISLDDSTYLQIDNIVNFGELIIDKEVNSIQSFLLLFNKNLKISSNYYLYYTKNDNNLPVASSHFCYFKVINCQENCSKCHSKIVGTSEAHQCETCIEGYLKYNNGKNEEGYYNCYKQGDSNIPDNMFYNETNGEYEKCDESCKECFSTYDCKSCNIGHYFKYNTEQNPINDNRCYATTPKNYYLNTSFNISHNNETVKYIYKPCYSTCETCIGDGNEINNNCIECKDNFTKYPFDERKCTINKNNCTEKYWRLDPITNNIECINSCNYFIIKNITDSSNNNNLNQCVENCNIFLNPYIGYQSLLSFDCGGERICITVDECNYRQLKNENGACIPDGDNCIFIPRTTVIETIPPSSPPPTQTPTQPPETTLPITHLPTEILKSTEPPGTPMIIEDRVRLIKNLEKNKFYSEIKENFKNIQLNDYIKELKQELSIGDYINGIDFITFFNYKDFNITIYPLKAEQYAKDNLFDVKNLIYINFTKLFMNYEIKEENYQILIALIERNNINIPINTVNYFFTLFNEQTNDIKDIKDFNYDNNLLEITYPLYNFENVNISDKYSKILISTIKELNSINPNFDFFEIQNSFYSDICNTDILDDNIDITIKDRFNYYYTEISFCENECSFQYIFDKDKNPKSLCECKIKKTLNIDDPNYIFNSTSKEPKSISNIKVLTCYKEVFSSGKLSSNPFFWIFFIMIFIHIALFISIFFCAKSSIENLLKSKKRNIVNENNENFDNYYNNLIQNNNNNLVQNNNNNNLKNGNEELNQIEKNSKKQINIKESVDSFQESESKEFKFSKKDSSEANPPKRKSNKSRETTSDKHNKRKENETSLFESDLNYNFDKGSGFEDIFDDIGGEGITPKVNNYIADEKNIQIDNYIYLEKKNILGKIIKSFQPLDKKELNKFKYNNTVIEINEIEKNKNINITGINMNKKNNYSMDDMKINNKNLNFINYSGIKNKRPRLSKYSKLLLEESMFSGNGNLIKSINNIDINNNNKKEDDYEKNLKENNNNNNKDGSENNANISEKKSSEINSQISNLSKKKMKDLIDSSYDSKNSRNSKNPSNASLNSKDKLLSKRNIKNEKEEQNQKLKENEVIIFHKKSSISSSSSDSEIDNSLIISGKDKNLCYFYCDYFVQREIFLCTFYHKQDNVSIFFRLPTFFSVIGFILMINCLFLKESDIHKRYEYYLENGKIDEFKYAFKNNLGKCLIIALIAIVFKMICIKLVYFVTFKISSSIKDEISPYIERNMNQLEFKQFNSKKKKYLKKYKRRSIIFMIIILILLFVFAYISICYVGILKNSFATILINSVISIIFSFIYCALLCFIISIFYIGGCSGVFNVMKIFY